MADNREEATITTVMRRFRSLSMYTITAALILILGFYSVVAYGIYYFMRAGHFQLAAGPISAQVQDVLWFSLLCGAASAATIEVAKRVFPLRGVYHRRSVIRWLTNRAFFVVGDRRPEHIPEIHRIVLSEFFDAMQISKHSLNEFNLPIEQLSAQISAASDMALTRPRDYALFLSSLAQKSMPPTFVRQNDDGEEGVDYDRSFFSQRVQSGVDQLQISVGERWRRYVQATAVWVSGAYGIALSSAGSSLDARPRYIVSALVIGGPLAWILRDLTAVVERLRR